MSEPSILVIGAGPAGLSLARALSMRGLRVDVIERQSRAAIAEPAPDGREIALTRSSMRLLRELGILDRIDAAKVAPLVRARVADGDAGEGFEVDAGPFGHEALGSLVANSDIRAAAWAVVEADPRIRVHFDARVASVAAGSRTAEVVLEDGQRFEAPLLGDAAVGMHPVTAHGFNLGLASVERLACAVADSMSRHGDPADPALLARYQRRHRAGCATLFLGTALVVRLFTDDRLPLRPLRRAIIGAGRALPPLRRALADALLDDGPVDPTPLQRLRRGFEVLRPRSPGGPRLQ